MTSAKRIPAAIFLALAICLATSPRASAQAGADPHSIPAVDGAIGSCSVEFTVNDAAGAPVYDAKLRVHIAYGFMRTHKLDLEVGTNSDGKARFSGLPEKIKGEPMHFYATQGGRQAEWIYNPAGNCTARQTLVVAASNPQK